MEKIGILAQQSAAIPARRHLSSSPKWDSGNSGEFCLVFSSTSSQRWMKQPASGGKCWVDLHSLQWSRNSIHSIGNQERMRRCVSPVMSAVQPTSEDVPSIDELKAELYSLQQEASQARDRYESSRARFMRLAQVAEQFQQRAVVDLKLGKEGTARQLLIEKKKVMNVADVSKRRSQLYELLSIKLSEAISLKETQLLAALSSVPAKGTVSGEPTVRVIFPKEDSPVPFEEVLEQELDEILSFGVSGQPSLGPYEEEGGDGISPLSVEAVEDDGRVGETDTGTTVLLGDVFPAQTLIGPGQVQVVKHDSEVEETDSLRTIWDHNAAKEDKHSDNEVESTLWEDIERAAKDLERDVLSLQEESGTFVFKLQSVLFSDKEENVESSSRGETDGSPDTTDTRMDTLHPDQEEINCRHEESHTDEKTVKNVDLKSVFEEYLLDIDSQVAGLESKLQSFLATADILLGSCSEMNDEKICLIKYLLQQVQSLRTKILDGVNKSIGQQSR